MTEEGVELLRVSDGSGVVVVVGSGRGSVIERGWFVRVLCYVRDE